MNWKEQYQKQKYNSFWYFRLDFTTVLAGSETSCVSDVFVFVAVVVDLPI